MRHMWRDDLRQHDDEARGGVVRVHQLWPAGLGDHINEQTAEPTLGPRGHGLGRLDRLHRRLSSHTTGDDANVRGLRGEMSNAGGMGGGADRVGHDPDIGSSSSFLEEPKWDASVLRFLVVEHASSELRERP